MRAEDRYFKFKLKSAIEDTFSIRIRTRVQIFVFLVIFVVVIVVIFVTDTGAAFCTFDGGRRWDDVSEGRNGGD